MRSWDELHRAAKRLYKIYGSIILIDHTNDGLKTGPLGVHGVLGGLMFGNNMDTISEEKRKKVDEVLKRYGY